MTRAAAFLIFAAALWAVGYLFGVLTPDQRAREIAGWFGSGADEVYDAAAREQRRLVDESTPPGAEPAPPPVPEPERPPAIETEPPPADLPARVQTLLSAASAGDRNAQFELASVYDQGDGVSEDDAAAVLWFRRAAEQGHYGAQHSLGAMYQFGRGVAVDLAEARAWYIRAAEDGQANTNNSLAWFLATTSEDALRDGERAIAAAEIAVGLEPENANIIDTLAAAYAEAGRFGTAIETQARAIEILERAGQTSAIDDYRSRLELYQRGQPARY